ncbi:hypothetical protein PAXRUDRAFT_13423 [Paxillus rubicundulus Ve08.2h10]|uniref:Uncharacterized protein n=1 Tax=Paxillus rubicundulus Ve08.2h10 TaxID=930991 RepID=A0A0D0E4E0_9AGAM|nr:hypothetical protein PAXRUDRAFT_13423 [Paxillus rubicundulus Ve08.2h10]
MSFIQALKSASTTDPVTKLSDDAFNRLHNPPSIPLVIDNPGVRHSISTYLALEHLSQAAYERVCCSSKHNFMGTPGAEDVLSFHNVKKLMGIHTGVEPLLHDMCPNTCHAFTGPFSNLDKCYNCQTSRWNAQKLHGSNRCVKVPAQQFTTIPVGSQLQAHNCNPDSARDMHYLWEQTQTLLDEIWRSSGAISVVDDIIMGWDYLGAVLDGDIKEHETVLMLSLDGAQLYNTLQHEGLPMWDPLTDSRYISHLYLLFTTADGPGLVYWDGMVGHSGKNGFHVYCGVLGCCKDHGTHYYPALLSLHDRTVAGLDHNDIDTFEVPQGGSAEYADNLKKIVSVCNQTQWDRMKTETGLTKPPLILGLNSTHSLGVTLCMMTDIMHLAGNLSNLLISL